MRRRDLLAGTALGLALGAMPAAARTIAGALPWVPDAGSPPVPVTPGPWKFFTADEAKAVEALVDRIIPPDPPGSNPQTPGGKDAGCAVYIDAQLAGPFGSARGLYMRPPFQDGTPEQGHQSPLTPAQRYRQSLAALDKHCRDAFAGKSFAELGADQQDQIIGQMEKGPLKLDGANATAFFEQLLKNTQEGFLADPIYGGNRDMVGWKMLGFPGARYDYRDWIDRHNERYTLPPVGIGGRKEWTPT